MEEAAGRPPAQVPALSLRGLARDFGRLRAVDDVSLDIREGEFLTIVGPSGSGKSTLVRLLAGLERPTAGRVLLRGQDITGVPANRRPTAMVFQSLALFDHRSVGQNIEFAMKMRGVPPVRRRARARELMNLVRLPEDYYARPVTQCSGGERQRVALARALASDPEILFFDEPLSAIDYRLRKTLEVELKELHRRTGRTFVYITHSLEEAMAMSDRIAIMREGRFVQLGTPREIYGRPASRFVAAFMGEVNILAVEGQGLEARFAGLNVSAPDAPAPYAVLRPEALSLGGEGDATLNARLVHKVMLGSRTQLHLDAGGTPLIAEATGEAPDALSSGDEATLGFRRADLAWVPE